MVGLPVVPLRSTGNTFASSPAVPCQLQGCRRPSFAPSRHAGARRAQPRVGRRAGDVAVPGSRTLFGVAGLLAGVRRWWNRVRTVHTMHAPRILGMQGLLESEGHKVTLLAAVVNVVLSLLKLVLGFVSQSAALVADAAHSLSDLLSDAVTMLTLSVAQIPPDEDHPYGHGRFEAIGALGVGGLVTAAGLSMTSQIRAVFSAHAIVQTNWALFAIIISILSKEVLYRMTAAVGKRLNSPVIMANAQHHRSDVWSSVVAFIGVVGASMGFTSLDPLAGAVVGIMVLRMGAEITVDAIGQLTDTANDEVMTTVTKAAKKVSGVQEVTSARARSMGSSWVAEVEVVPDAFTSSASAAEHLAMRVRAAVLDTLEDATECLVTVRAAPQNTPGLSLPTPKEVDLSAREVLDAIPEIVKVEKTVTHFDAHKLVLEALVSVRPELSVFDCTQLTHEARQRVLKKLPAGSTMVVHLKV
mmetsp:Transcript_53261/g.98462  ORF Transcript_53261/g.98462 Transcript_53261/m.98462 type:complete len:470 (+) Transcript_53261:52-1461(+)